MERVNEFAEAKARLADIVKAEAEERKRLIRKYDWEDDEDEDLVRRDRRRKSRLELLDRLVPTRHCPLCKELKIRSQQWVVAILNDRTGIAICKSCFLRTKHNPLRKELLVMKESIFTKKTRWNLDPDLLVKAREEAEITQSEFARLAGWSRAYQNKLENDHVETISDEARKVVLGVLKRKNIETGDRDDN